MKSLRSILTRLSASLLMLGALATSAPAAQAASDGPYRMEVLINGVPVREYDQQAKTYIEARKGREYSVRLTNRTGERVAVALSVDGLNSIDAKHTSAAAARKWVLGPYESITIDGWQTSSATARQFYFTNEASSYGAWLGKTRDLGNISAAFFREDRPEPPPYYYEDDRSDDYEGYGGMARNEAAREKSSSRRAAPAAPSASAAKGMASDAAPQGIMPEQKRSRQPAPQEELAATGIGRERQHDVYTVEFKQESRPSAVITVRYEFRDKLIQMGILPRPYRPDPMSRRESSSGFTDYGYAPDPYRSR